MKKAMAIAAIIGSTLAGMGPVATAATGLGLATAVVATTAAVEVAQAPAAEAVVYRGCYYTYGGQWGYSGPTGMWCYVDYSFFEEQTDRNKRDHWRWYPLSGA